MHALGEAAILQETFCEARELTVQERGGDGD
jgi:hypothetical protein